MAEKLSESLTKLAAKTKSIEDKIRKAREESKEKLNKKIEESKAELQIKKDNFITHADSLNAKVAGEFDSFNNFLDQKAEHFKSEAKKKTIQRHKKPEERNQEHDMSSAERHYNNSVDYAKSCIEWAMIALAEVEISALETFAARLHSENLKETDIEDKNEINQQ
jgi:hypothetical protein